jgi:uncharacterized protein YbaR (Trm112 family)
LVSQNREMKVLCPKCKQKIALGYVEETGEQSAYCKKCNIHIHANYAADEYR